MAGLLSSTPQRPSDRPVPVAPEAEAPGRGGLLGEAWRGFVASQSPYWRRWQQGLLDVGQAVGGYARDNPLETVASSGVPVVADAAGLLADAKMYATDPESRTWGNAALTGAGLLPFVPAMAGMTGRVFHATNADEPISEFRRGRGASVYVNENPDRALTAAQASKRERAGGGLAWSIMPLEIKAPVAGVDDPPRFPLPGSMTGKDGYYDESELARLREQIETFTDPSLDEAETGLARDFLRRWLDERFDEITGAPRQVSPGRFPPPSWPEFEHGRGAYERGYSNGTSGVVGARGRPDAYRRIYRALGFEGARIGDEGGRSVAVFGFSDDAPLSQLGLLGSNR
jgi:hypothetical protein